MDEMLVILNTAEGGYHHNILIFTNNFFYEECISESDLNKFELYDDSNYKWNTRKINEYLRSQYGEKYRITYFHNDLDTLT